MRMPTWIFKDDAARAVPSSSHCEQQPHFSDLSAADLGDDDHFALDSGSEGSEDSSFEESLALKLLPRSGSRTSSCSGTDEKSVCVPGTDDKPVCATSHPEEVLLVVSRAQASPYRVLEAGRAWLTKLKFNARDMKGKSLRMVSGPDTDWDAASRMVQDATQHEGAAQLFTLYSKSGDDVEVSVAASARSSDEVVLRLVGQDDELFQGEHAASAIQATFMVQEPYCVCSSTVAFNELYQFDQSKIEQEGLALIFGWRTDGRRWKNMIRRAVQGATVRCVMYTYPSYGNELDTRLVVSPVTNHPDRLSLEVEICPQEQQDSSSGWQESSMNSSSNSSWDSQVSRTESHESCEVNDMSNEAVRVHLKAMRAHRAIKDLQAGLQRAASSGPLSCREPVLTRNESC